VHEHSRRGVDGQELELGQPETPVEGEQDGAQAEAGELELEGVGGVGQQHGDALSALYPQLSSQVAGQPAHPFVELGVGQTAAGRLVHRGQLARAATGVVCYPVVGSEGEGGAHAGSSQRSAAADQV
jgi:hypothetical protein